MIAYERFLKLRETESGDSTNKFVDRTQPLEAKQPLDQTVEQIIADEKKSQPQEQEQQELQEQEQVVLTDEEKRQQISDTTTKNVSNQNLNQGNVEAKQGLGEEKSEVETEEQRQQSTVQIAPKSSQTFDHRKVEEAKQGLEEEQGEVQMDEQQQTTVQTAPQQRQALDQETTEEAKQGSDEEANEIEMDERKQQATVTNQVVDSTVQVTPTQNQTLQQGNSEEAKNVQVAPPLPPKPSKNNQQADELKQSQVEKVAQSARVSTKANGGVDQAQDRNANADANVQSKSQAQSQKLNFPRLPFPSWVRDGAAKMMDKFPKTGGYLRKAFNGVVKAVKDKAHSVLMWIYRKDIDKAKIAVNDLESKKNNMNSPRTKGQMKALSEFYKSDIKRGLLEYNDKKSEKGGVKSETGSILLQRIANLVDPDGTLLKKTKEAVEAPYQEPSTMAKP